ncbi:hypothetical protein Csa_005338 [Cucumis sativus]|uniref:Uncharacterized protein n=1 Tax=Cucumis sativus TaxID=3659 RepID=A0A0A0K8L2_CUCSA|nr:hypothetical protein Csa_005338 [Cucumis sativus]
MALTFLYSTTSFSSSSSLTRRFPNYHFRLRNSPIFLHNWSLSSFLNHSLFITGRIGFVLLIPALTLLFIFFAAASAAFHGVLNLGFSGLCCSGSIPPSGYFLNVLVCELLAEI